MLDFQAAINRSYSHPYNEPWFPPEEEGQEGAATAEQPRTLEISPPAQLTPRQQADILRHKAAAIFLHGAFNRSFAGKIEMDGCKLFLDEQLEDAGYPPNSVESILISQIIFLHMMQMKVMSCCMTLSGEPNPVMLATWTRLSAELRRLVATLKSLTKKPKPCRLTELKEPKNITSGD